MHKIRRKQDIEEKTHSCREIRILSLWVIYRSRREFSWSSASIFYAERLCDVHFEDTRLSRKELSASRGICYELSKKLRRDIRLARIPIGLFSPTARSFQLLPFDFLFSVVFLYEKRSAVSFPPDVAPSKDIGEHWTLLHEIYSYVCFSPSARTYTFFRTVIDIRLWPSQDFGGYKSVSEKKHWR